MKIIKMSLLVMFHPVVAFSYIQKERERFQARPIVVLLLLGVIVRLFSLQFTHYPLSSITMRSNLVLEVAKLFVPLVSWGICSYLMTTILDGETLFRESMLAVSYALTPYIVFMIPGGMYPGLGGTADHYQLKGDESLYGGEDHYDRSSLHIYRCDSLGCCGAVVFHLYAVSRFCG